MPQQLLVSDHELFPTLEPPHQNIPTLRRDVKVSVDKIVAPDTDISTTGMNPGSAKKDSGVQGLQDHKYNKEFHDLFPDVPIEEYLIASLDCVCSVCHREKAIEHKPKGTLYVSKNYACYTEHSMCQILLPTNGVISIQRRKDMHLPEIVNSYLRIVTLDSDYQFHSSGEMWSESDREFDTIHNMWRTWMHDSPFSQKDVDLGGGPASKQTLCMCLKNGQHPNVTVMDAVLLGTPEEIYNQMFMSDFVKDFMLNKNDVFGTNVAMSNWAPTSHNAPYGLVVRTMDDGFSNIREEIIHYDLDDHISVVSTDANATMGTVIRRTCIMWESMESSRIIITMWAKNSYSFPSDELTTTLCNVYAELMYALSIRIRDRILFKEMDIGSVAGIRMLLFLETGLDILFAMDSSRIPLVLDLLQMESRTADLDYEYREKCRSFLQLLVKKHHVLPPSLFVQRITSNSAHIVAVGGYSDIYKGTLEDKLVCLKVLRVYVEDGEEKKNKDLYEFYKEALLWTQFDHPNILPFLGVNTTLFPGKIALVAPWMANGEITKFLKANPQHDRFRVISEIAAGIAYLHSHNIVHGDIKGANVLVDAEGQCHLADFGLATAAMTSSLFNSKTSGIGKGTTRWMAPEVLTSEVLSSEESRMFCIEPLDQNFSENTKPYNVKLASDIYAYACTVYEILAGEVPFAHLKVDAQVILTVIRGGRPKRPTEACWCPDNVWDLVEQCWAQESHRRPTAAVVHSYLTHMQRDFLGELISEQKILRTDMPHMYRFISDLL